MMDNKMMMNTRVYTDIQGLQKLKYDSNTAGVKKEVAQQFESILMQMVLSSMRNANKAFSSGMFGSDQMEMYQDLFDKQLSLVMSNSGVGFADMIEKNINQNQSAALAQTPQATESATTTFKSLAPRQNLTEQPEKNAEISAIQSTSSSEQPKKETFKSPEDFVTKLWSAAKYAAKIIGTNPEILLAQAALETNWGKNILPQGKNSTHNLFNIKADSSWDSKITTVQSLEEKNGVLVKEKSNFRSYDSYMESFMDYANFLKQNKRYSESLDNALNPEKFVNSLQNAGYATDQNYADKILKIFSSRSFQNLVTKVKSNA